MRVLLVRHSLAVSEGPGLPDGSRYLSPEGRERALTVADRLASQGVELDRVLTSPLVRAVQTAELLARRLPCGEVLVLDALSPGVAPEAVIRRMGPATTVALVGHAPGISAVGALLVSQPSFPPLRPGQVAVIEGGRPEYSVNPETLEIEPLLLPG